MTKHKRLLMRTTILTVLGAVILLTVFANLIKGERPGLKVGDTAPDFVLLDENGRKHQLSDYKGQGVLVNFWATYCKYCVEEMALFEKMYEKHKDDGLQILAVNIGETDMVIKRFLESNDLSFPILNDKNQEVVNAYGVNPLPVTFLIDKKGTIAGIHIGEIIDKKMASDLIEPIIP